MTFLLLNMQIVGIKINLKTIEVKNTNEFILYENCF